MSYFQLGALFKGISTTVTTGGTTTLTLSSKQLQQFTGTSAQTVVLPAANTLVNARRFDILNRSTGDITVNADGGGLIATVPAGSQRFFFLTDNSTAAGVWRTGGVTSSNTASVTSADKLNLLAGMGGINASTENIEARSLKYLPEEVGGNFWTQKTPVTLQKTWAAVFNLNGFVYNVGGCASGTDVATNERYSDDGDFWYSRGNLNTARDSSAAYVLSGLAYTICGLTGGSSTNSAVNESYNDVNDAWTAKTSYPTALYGPACFALDNTGYVAGGLISPTYQSIVYSYDVTANAWAVRHSLSTASGRCSGSDSAYNDNGYSFGGTNSNGRVERYNKNTNSWTTVRAMSIAHAYAALMIMNGTVTMGGGENNTAGVFVSTSEQYTDSINYWKAVANITSTAVDTNGASLNGRGFKIGGGTGTSTHINTVEAYTSSAYINAGLLKRVFNTAPTSILLSVQAKSMSNMVGAQLRTDGDNWKAIVAGSDAALKLGEAYSTKFLEYPLGYNAGGGTGTATTDNERYNDVQNIQETRTALTSARRGPFYFTIAGIGYIAGGQDSGATLQTNTYSYSDILNAWVTKSGNMAAAKEEGASFTILGLGYALCGTPAGGTFTNTNYQYSATNDAYTVKTSSPISRRSPASFTLQDWGYVAGGVSGSTGSPTYTGTAGHKYNPLTDSWTALGNLATGVGDNSGGFAIGNYGYSVAGYNGSADQTTVQKYTPATNTWASAGNINTARSKATTYRVGGFGYASGGAIIANHEQYNPDSQASINKTSLNVAKVNGGAIGAGSARQYELRIGVPAYYAGLGGAVWVSRQSMNTARDTLHGTSVNSEYYAFGGYNGSYLSVAERYSKNSNTWTSIADMGSNRVGPGAFTVQGRPYVFSGEASNGPTYSSQTRGYNIETNAYFVAATMNQSNWSQGGGAALNGFGYRVNGRANAAATGLADAERYNTSADSWFTTASLSQQRYNNAVAVCSGLLYSLGGINSGTNYANTDMYSDASNSWTSRTAMSGVRRGGIAAEFGGKITISGGFNGSYLATTEEFNPDMNAWVSRSNKITAIGFANVHGDFEDQLIVAGGSTGFSAVTETLVPSLKNATLGFALEIK